MRSESGIISRSLGSVTVEVCHLFRQREIRETQGYGQDDQ